MSEGRCNKCANKKWIELCKVAKTASCAPCSEKRTIHFKSGSFIEPCLISDSILMINDGLISVFEESASGKNEACVGIRKNNDFLGIERIFNSGKKLKYECLTPVTGFLVPKREFIGFLQGHKNNSYDVFLYTMKINSETYDTLLSTKEGNLKQRCSRLLYHLSLEKCFQDFQKDSKSLRLSQKQLSRILGCTRESINRALKNLELESIIELSNRKIHIKDPIKLALEIN